MPFKRYWRRSEKKKGCHGDNNVVSEATFWCVALQKHRLRISYTFDVDVLRCAIGCSTTFHCRLYVVLRVHLFL